MFSLYESIFFALSNKANVKHYEQKYNWDCGHTCLRMVIHYCDIQKSVDDALIDLEELHVLEKPLWTIDLYAYLMKQGVVATFHTLCADGVTADHEAIDWYQNTNLVEDKERVKVLFNMAVDEAWPVHEV